MADDVRMRVVELDKQRRNARTALQGDVHQARHDLHPGTIFGRWKAMKRDQFISLAGRGKQNLAKNAPLIGLAGAAILLFAVRKPISNVIKHLRDKAQDTKDRKT